MTWGVGIFGVVCYICGYRGARFMQRLGYGWHTPRWRGHRDNVC